MRWQTIIGKIGSKRTITKFLWLPKTIWLYKDQRIIGDETRWLETASFEEEWLGSSWVATRWID